MKNNILVLLLAVSCLTSCKDFLAEENRQSLTDNTIFSDPSSFDQLVANTYSRARTATSFYELDQLGTDIYTRGDMIAGIDELNDYVNLRPFHGSLSTFWDNYYFLVAAANTAIDRSSTIAGLGEAEKAKGIGEAKFFRAFAYFALVQQFGGVPLILNEVRSAQTDFSRADEQAVYTSILADLDDALGVVEESPAQFGRISKSAVRHLKSKVLLTRGYKSFKGSNDFSEAAALAESVTARHPLASDLGALFSKAGQRNSEVVLSLLYGNNPVTRGVGNNRHLQFKFVYDIYPGMTRSTLYHRGLGPAPTPFFFSLFEEGDKRENVTIRRTMLAEVANTDRGISVGDTVIHFPKSAWSSALIASKKYTVVNPGAYFIQNGITQIQYPMFRKFDEPGVPYTTGGNNPEGERDAIIMRSGESRLIAAEAYLNSGDKAKAAAHVNALRSRAGLAKMLTADEITIDVILNESAKELAGEVGRWTDLKRTGKLLERALAHNPHVALNKALKDFHLLRPIPNREVDLGDGKITQNPGY
jgi:hypothetical protein